jgi:hypothetical protein
MSGTSLQLGRPKAGPDWPGMTVNFGDASKKRVFACL